MPQTVEQQIKWRKLRKKEIAQWAKDFRKRHAERIKLQKKAAYQRDKERIKAKNNAHYHANAKAIIKKQMAYHQKHKYRNGHYFASSKARKRGCPINIFGLEEFYKFVKTSKSVLCHYCNTETVDAVVDHIIPLSRGGAHSIENVCACCVPCNLQKGDKLVSEWKLTHNQS